MPCPGMARGSLTGEVAATRGEWGGQCEDMWGVEGM